MLTKKRLSGQEVFFYALPTLKHIQPNLVKAEFKKTIIILKKRLFFPYNSSFC